MSGVNLKQRTLQLLPGLFFQRQDDGSMRVMTTNGELPLDTGANLRSDQTVPADEWDEVVSNEFRAEKSLEVEKTPAADAPVGHGG